MINAIRQRLAISAPAPAKSSDNQSRAVSFHQGLPPPSPQSQLMKVEIAGSDFTFRWCSHGLGDVRMVHTILQRLNLSSSAVNYILLEADYYYAEAIANPEGTNGSWSKGGSVLRLCFNGAQKLSLAGVRIYDTRTAYPMFPWEYTAQIGDLKFRVRRPVSWNEGSKEIQEARRFGVMELLGRDGGWLPLGIRLSFHPSDTDYLSFTLLNGF